MSEKENIMISEAADLDNSITLKSLAGLLDKKFFIPSYQRGYRWTEQQVKELLSDIDSDCIIKDKNGKEDGEKYYMVNTQDIKDQQQFIDKLELLLAEYNRAEE